MPELTALLTATAVFTSALAFAAQADEVHVLNWKGYGADEPWAVEAFEKATGNKVVNDFFNSEQEMLTKIRTNPGLYDVVDDQRRLQRPGDGGKADPADRRVEAAELCRHQPGQVELADARP